MSKKPKVALFWPGDARAQAQRARPAQHRGGHRRRSSAPSRKLGRETYRIEGFLAKPHEAIEKLGPVHDPMIGVCVHWFYGPHTTDGVVGKDNPLLLACNFSGRWPGLVGPAQHRRLPREPRPRLLPRVDATRPTGARTRASWTRLDEWCTTGAIRYPEDEIAYHAPVSAGALGARARRSPSEIRKRRVLILMLGDTSMGMINGYFGPRLLNQHGFTEHKVDQAWIIDRGRRIDERAHRRRARAS